MPLSLLLLLNVIVIGSYAQTPSANRNFVLETIVKSYGRKTVGSLSGLTVDSANRTVRYLDGLGRPLQTVVWQGSPDRQDVVTPFVYDVFGREAIRYQPYADGAASGSYRTGAVGSQATFYNSPGSGMASTAYPFSVSVFESSPLNRVTEQGFPGVVWQPNDISVPGSGHTSRPLYLSNSAGEVPLWNVVPGGAQTTGGYSPGTLRKNVSRDENTVSGSSSGTVEEFVDLDGRLVMKRAWETGGVARDTRYIYDRMGNLLYVLPPGISATAFTDTDAMFLELVHAYRYDGRRRVVEKKIPGKGWEHIVYNALDQIVFSQDQKLRLAGQWLFNKYDAFGRVVLTGVYADGNTRENIQTGLDGMTGLPLWEVRDNTNVSLTGTGYTNNAYPNVSIVEYHTVSFHDDYDFLGNGFGSPIGSQASGSQVKGLVTGIMSKVLSVGNMLLTVNYYDLDGRVVQTKSSNHLSGMDVVDNTYSFSGELTSSVRTHTAYGATTVISSGFSYDHMGRMKQERNNINGQGDIVLSEKVYNVLGQPFQQKLAGGMYSTELSYNERGWLRTNIGDRFSLSLQYQDGIHPQYNGNISGQRWDAGASFPLSNWFSYQYDGLQRLTNATSNASMSEAITYDAMGNISTLNRNSSGPNQYHYFSGGNRLHYVDNVTGAYGYDVNGNAETDGRTGMLISYNHLNLPVSASAGNNGVAYTYEATGRKLRKSVSGGTPYTTDYVEGVHYAGTVIDFIQTSQGRALNNGGSYSYQYNISDHLGNVRYSFDIYGGAVRDLQRDDYHAFGLRITGPAGGDNLYLYNGKEIQQELGGQYDYGARFYDPVIGRWNVADPLAGRFVSLSPYSYTDNNPANNTDPTGMATYYGTEALEVFEALRSGLSDSAGEENDEEKRKRQTDSPDDWLQKLLALIGIGPRNGPRSNAHAQEIAQNQEPFIELNKRAEKTEETMIDIPVYGGMYQFMKFNTGSFSKKPNYLLAGLGLVSTSFDIIGGAEVATAYKTLAQLGLKDGVKRSAGEVLELAQKFLGKGYKETVSGSGRFISADGKRVFRMGKSDITGAHGGGPHVNFETLVPNPAKPGKMIVKDNYHIFLNK